MRRGTWKLIAFAASFVTLTVGGAVWAIARAPIGWRDLRVLTRLSPLAIALLVVLSAAVYAADVLRYRAVGRAVGAPVPWRAALDTSVANFFFSWITPGSTFGVPATIYMLGRRGVPWDATVVIAFGKAFTGVAVVVTAAVLLVAVGLGPRYDRDLLAIVLFGGAIFCALFGAMIAAAIRPAPARRVVGAGFGWLGRRLGHPRVFERGATVTGDAIDRLATLRDGGPRPLLALALTHALFFGATAGVGLVLLTAFGGAADLRSFCALVVYIAFTYLAPTPGGAGFAEAMAVPFFGPLLPADQAVLFVLCFRGLTLYVQVVFAVPYMLLVGGVGEILARAARKRPAADG